MAEHIRIITKEEEEKHDADIMKYLGIRFLTDIEVAQKLRESQKTIEKINIYLYIMSLATIAGIIALVYFLSINLIISTALLMILGLIFPLIFWFLLMMRDDKR